MHIMIVASPSAYNKKPVRKYKTSADSFRDQNNHFSAESISGNTFTSMLLPRSFISYAMDRLPNTFSALINDTLRTTFFVR